MQLSRLIRAFVVLAATTCCQIDPCGAQDTFRGAVAKAEPVTETELVQSFVDAFNRRDLGAMMSSVTDSIEWVNLSGATASIETSGKEALAQSLKSYFASCPTCRSGITILGQSGPFLVALERATWESGGTAKAQESISVYQFENGAIQRVWYFPAVKQP